MKDFKELEELASNGMAQGTGRRAAVVHELNREVHSLRQQVVMQESMIEALRRQAMEDPLTGLNNRRAFEEELERSLAYFRRYQRNGALLLLDVDEFKYINDTLGHLAGDTILRHISHILTSYTRETDTVARIGGDEFCVLLHEVEPAEAYTKARELTTVIARSPCSFNGKKIHTQVSIGTCAFGEAQAAKELLSRADEAMYLQKEQNRATLRA